MQKADYEMIKDIKARIAKKKPTTFAERNIVNIYDKKMKKKKKAEEELLKKK